jgi:integrase
MPWLAVASRRMVHSILRHALNDAVRWGDLPRNPTAGANPPKQTQTRVTSWTGSELRRFLKHVADDRLFAIWRLAATTGMRRGALLGLTWQNVDLAGLRLRVDRQLIRAGGELQFGDPKSRRGVRTIALDDGTAGVLGRHCELQALERDLAGEVYDDHDLVFCDELGRPITPGWLTQRFRRLREEAGVPVGSLHVLRHTAATLALEARVPLHVVAARLGDDPRTVLATYAHLLPVSDSAAADAVAAALVDSR